VALQTHWTFPVARHLCWQAYIILELASVSVMETAKLHDP